MRYLDTAKILASSNLIHKLTGDEVSSRDCLPIWAISKDKDEIFMQTLWERPGGVGIVRESEDLACHVAALTSKLYAQSGSKRWIIDLDSDGKAIAFELPEEMKYARNTSVFQVELGRGVLLSVWNQANQLHLRDVESFLGDAMSYFKTQRKFFGKDAISSIPYVNIVAGRKHPLVRLELATCQLGAQSQSTLDLCVRTTINAYAASTTAADIGQDPNLVIEYLECQHDIERDAVRAMSREERLLFTFAEIIKRHTIHHTAQLVA